MDMTLYLPDALATEARQYELKYSRLFQQAIRDEITAIKTLRSDQGEVRLPIEDENGGRYVAQFNGKRLAQGDKVSVYYSEDSEQFIVYDRDDEAFTAFDDAEEMAEGAGLDSSLDDLDYVWLMNSLGIRPVVSI